MSVSVFFSVPPLCLTLFVSLLLLLPLLSLSSSKRRNLNLSEFLPCMGYFFLILWQNAREQQLNERKVYLAHSLKKLSPSHQVFEGLFSLDPQSGVRQKWVLVRSLLSPFLSPAPSPGDHVVNLQDAPFIPSTAGLKVCLLDDSKFFQVNDKDWSSLTSLSMLRCRHGMLSLFLCATTQNTRLEISRGFQVSTIAFPHLRSQYLFLRAVCSVSSLY